MAPETYEVTSDGREIDDVMVVHPSPIAPRPQR